MAEILGRNATHDAAASSPRLSRRSVLALIGAGAALAGLPSALRAQSVSHVVVVGGGFGGATAAKYLRLWSEGTIEVTLVDPNPSHYSCVMSNLVLTGQIPITDLRFPLADLAANYGFTLVRDTVASIDAAAARVSLASGATLAYDRLILSPGTSFKKVPGLNTSKIPHAWIAGTQTVLLRRQLAAMPVNGTFVMTIPPAPYRCPPGPYERACVIAGALKARGGGRVIVLDANPDIVVEKDAFHAAFSELYGDIIDYRAGAVLKGVDSPGKTVVTSAGSFSGDVVNVIPPHQAPALVRRAGLTAGGDWAPVHPLTFESTVSEFAGVHVIGDSQALAVPKSGHHANAEAKVCVDAVIRLLAGEAVDSPERVANITTNSACYSPVSADEALFLTAGYAYQAPADNPWNGSLQLIPEAFGSAVRWSRGNHRDMFTWWENLRTDVFG